MSKVVKRPNYHYRHLGCQCEIFDEKNKNGQLVSHSFNFLLSTVILSMLDITLSPSINREKVFFI
jgi:hypothetical protein